MYYRKSAASFTEAALLSCVRSKSNSPAHFCAELPTKER